MVRALSLALLALSSSPVALAEPDEMRIVGACWEHQTHRERDHDGAIVTILAGVHIVCFQTSGWVAGLTFDDDGWDWSSRYSLHDGVIFFDKEKFGRLIDVDDRRMLVGTRRGPLAYRYLCRTEAEDIQCERLKTPLE